MHVIDLIGSVIKKTHELEPKGKYNVHRIILAKLLSGMVYSFLCKMLLSRLNWRDYVCFVRELSSERK